MKNINIIGIMLLSVAGGCSQMLSFPSISTEIYNKAGGKNDKSFMKLNNYKRAARMKIYEQDSASFLKGAIDTLFILEGYSLEEATLFETIWDKKHSISYSYFNGELAKLSKSGFTDYQKRLTTRWDTAAIRKEEKINGHWLGINMQISAFRCYKKGKSWQIDEFVFGFFLDPKRDH